MAVAAMVTQTPFDRALVFTLDKEVEGGLANVSGDRGGRTNHGVTQKTYDAWRLSAGRPRRPVDLIDLAEIYAIYHDEYWEPCACSQLPEALACCVFDMAVNSSPWHAKRTLQRALDVQVDGVIGPQTLNAARNTPDAVRRFLIKRGGFLQEVITLHPTDVQFLGGWIKRLLMLMEAFGK